MDLECENYEYDDEYKECVEYKCSKTIIEDIHHNISNEPEACPRSCTTLKYSGKVTFENLQQFPTGTEAILEYKFAEPAFVKVYQEYLIFDAIGMIGSVGGTLGLFIGLSFGNVLTFLIGYLQKFTLYLVSRLESSQL